MAVTRQNLIDRLNAMRAATPANPIKKSDFAQFLEDWLNYMTNDGAYSAGVLEQWKTETLALQNAKLNADITLANNAAAQALASAAAASLVASGTATVRPIGKPSLNFDFRNSRYVDPRIQAVFNRASVATYFDRNGIMRTAQANKPRINHNPTTGECLGILMETEDKENKLRYSHDLSVSTWTKNNLNLILSNKKFLDGTYCYEIVENSLNEFHDFTQTINSLDPTKSVTFSAYVQRGVGNRHVRLSMLTANGNEIKAYFNLDNLTTSYATGGEAVMIAIEATKEKEYIRVSVQAKLDSVSTTIFPKLNIMNASGSVGAQYQGDGVSSLLVSGLQFEYGELTSLIPTSANTYTRKADSIAATSNKFNELFPNTSEGTFLFSATKAKRRYDNTAYAQYYRFASTDDANAESISFTDRPDLDQIYSEIFWGATNKYVSRFEPIAAQTKFNSVMKWKKGEVRAFCNNVVGDVSATATPSQPLISFKTGSKLSYHLQRIAFWTNALTDVECQTLSNKNQLWGAENNQVPSVGELGGAAFMRVESILSSPSRQEFSVDCTGASITRNIRRPYPFLFEITDSSGVTLTTQPSASCVENTDNSLVFTGPAGKTLTYAITPVFEY